MTSSDTTQCSAVELWARSGAMWLTGRPKCPPSPGPAGAAALADRLLGLWSDAAARRLDGRPPAYDVTLLGERAAIVGLRRRGTVSCGGASRLLRAGSGHVVLSLARACDLELVPALVGNALPDSGPEAAWHAVSEWVSRRSAEDAVAWARTLDLPAAVVPASPADEAHVVEPVVVCMAGSTRPRSDRPLVVDLTALWAGPLCARLLAAAGADVIKVESVTRPDGARRGPAAFYDLLHANHRSVAIDFRDARHIAALRSLVESADVVLESSRPRALQRLGLVAEDIVDAGTTWVSVTAYGRQDPGAALVGFGDDVAAGAGLVARDGAHPLFCADAVADPLTGLAAGVACLESLEGPRAELLDVAMYRVAAAAARMPVEDARVHRTENGWEVEADSGLHAVHAPTLATPAAAAAPLGANTDEVLGRWLR